MNEFTERCERAIAELKTLERGYSSETPLSAARVSGKIEGMRLALDYYMQMQPAADVAALREALEKAQQKAHALGNGIDHPSMSFKSCRDKECAKIAALLAELEGGSE